ncbi:MAG: hypothetical protein ACLT2F_10840 [Butyricicoccus sp.]
MKVFSEPGVLSRSERFFSTPSATARRLFYYVTRVGHYYYDARYNFLDSCDIAHLESHKNLFLTYVRSGTMYFETDQLYCAERGQIGLVDCRRPHVFIPRATRKRSGFTLTAQMRRHFSSRYSRSAAAGRCLRRRRIYASSRSWHRSFPACAPAT